mmetsp:Transcript_15758/g.13788  ORF Transcript_15758/g.13788 Transcript_15758/m.13788 type:complete len:178 (+) Transcript_15758:423-956(+)
MMKKKNVNKSASLMKKHKNSKYAGIHLGGIEEKDFEGKINVIYMEGEENLKKSQHEKQLLRLLESSGTGTRGMNQLPTTQDSMRIAIKGGRRKSILQGNVLKNRLGDNKVLDKRYLGNEISIDRGVTGIQHLSAARPDRSEMRGLVIEQLQNNQFEKKSKRERSMSKTMNFITTKNK